MKGTYTSDSGVFQLHQDGHCPSGPFTPFPLPVDKLSQGVGTMEEKTLREQLCAVDGSLLFLGLLLLAVQSVSEILKQVNGIISDVTGKKLPDAGKEAQ